MKIKIICKNCGSVNEKDREVLLNPDYDEDDWLCELPVNFEWILPVGKISPIVGNPLYVSSLGGQHVPRRLHKEIQSGSGDRLSTYAKGGNKISGQSNGFDNGTVTDHVISNS